MVPWVSETIVRFAHPHHHSVHHDARVLSTRTPTFLLPLQPSRIHGPQCHLCYNSQCHPHTLGTLWFNFALHQFAQWLEDFMILHCACKVIRGHYVTLCDFGTFFSSSYITNVYPWDFLTLIISSMEIPPSPTILVGTSSDLLEQSCYCHLFNIFFFICFIAFAFRIYYIYLLRNLFLVSFSE